MREARGARQVAESVSPPRPHFDWPRLQKHFSFRAHPAMPPGPDPQKRPPPGSPPPMPGNPPPAPAPPGNRPPPPGTRPPPPGNRPPPPAAARRQAGPPAPRPKRRHRHGNPTRARIGLVVVFLLFRVVDFLFILGIPPEGTRLLVVRLCTAALWTTALLIAIALRHAWARVILLVLLALGIVAGLIVTPMVFDQPPLLTPMLTSLLVSAGVFAWLFWSRDVHRLTSRDRE